MAGCKTDFLCHLLLGKLGYLSSKEIYLSHTTRHDFLEPCSGTMVERIVLNISPFCFFRLWVVYCTSSVSLHFHLVKVHLQYRVVSSPSRKTHAILNFTSLSVSFHSLLKDLLCYYVCLCSDYCL